MGALGCKYCNCDQNNENKYEQINNNPIIITNKSDKNNYENDEININDIICNLNNEEKNKENNNNINTNNNIIKQDEEFVIEENKENKEKSNLKSHLEKSGINQFSITNKVEAKNKVKNYELSKIKFGLKSEDKQNMNQEQKKLYKEAETNLEQFSAPQGAEISKLQTIMSNILLKLNKFY